MRKTLGIGLGTAFGWPGLAWCWWHVVKGGDAPTLVMVAAPVVLALVTIAVTTWWVRHNLAIYRRKGPRREVLAAPSPYFADRRGRPLHFDGPHVRSGREVVVDIAADGAKHYRMAS